MGMGNSNPINIKGVMIMLNRVINRVLLSFVLIVLCSYSAIADNSQFHKRGYHDYTEQQKPLFQSDNEAAILELAGIDLKSRVTSVIETDNYIHKINGNLHYAIITHKIEHHKFVMVERLTLYITLRNGIWSAYNIPWEDQYNPITKLFRSTMIEYYKTGRECSPLTEQGSPSVIKEGEEGMMVF